MHAENFTISQPFTSQNLTVFLFSGAEPWPDANLLTLQEALDQKQFVVHETSDVNELAVENLSLFDVYVQAGDIVKGGLQDRAFAYDVIVPPHSGKLPLAAFCVEQGRWRQRHDEAGTSESVAQFHSARERVHTKELKRAALFEQSQGEVWNQVAEAQSRLSEKLGAEVRARHSATSLQLTLENEELEQQIAPYLRDLTPLLEQVDRPALGYALAINGKLNSAELYASHQLFKKLWPKLLKACAVEALSEREEGQTFAALSATEVMASLNQPAKSKAVAKRVTSRIKVIKRETAGLLVQDTCDVTRQGAWVHRSFLVK